VAQSPRAVAEQMIAAIESGFESRGLAGHWEIFFPDGSSDFEIRGDGLRLIVEVNRALDTSGLSRSVARVFNRGPVQARLRAWFLNEFVERLFVEAPDAVPIIFSILEAHRPSGRTLPTTVSGAPEVDSPDRPSRGADDPD
jgi:hypothetical protein